MSRYGIGVKVLCKVMILAATIIVLAAPAWAINPNAKAVTGGVAVKSSTVAEPLTTISIEGMPNLKVGTFAPIHWKNPPNTPLLMLLLVKNSTPVGIIARSLSALTGKYVWDVGKIIGSPNPVVVGPGYSIRLSTMDKQKFTDSAPFAISAGPSFSSTATPVGTAAIAVTAPNGPVSWPHGSKKTITWNAGGTTGNVRIELYKGGTDTANRRGTITSNTPAANGSFSWDVGTILGSDADPGADYRIMVASYTPDKKAFSPPFTISGAEISLLTAAGAKVATKSLSFLYPRRGDLLYKGNQYKLKWALVGHIPNSIEMTLLDKNGTKVATIENVKNFNAEALSKLGMDWTVPMTLPDAETLYSLELSINNGAAKATVGPFRIGKSSYAGPKEIKVLAPGEIHRFAQGQDYTIRWTSSCGTNPDGPTVDFFKVSLLAEDGKTEVRTLLEADYAAGMAKYDGQASNGVHNWSWSSSIALNETPGRYRIGVSNSYGNCQAVGEKFSVIQPQKLTSSDLKPKTKGSCYYLAGWSNQNRTTPNPNQIQTTGLITPDGLPSVGYNWIDNYEGGTLTGRVEYVIRGRADFGAFWYKEQGHLLSAKLVVTRKWKYPTPQGSGPSPTLQGVALLTGAVSCPSPVMTYPANPAVPFMPGTLFPVNAASGDSWEIDVTDHYRTLIKSGKQDFGAMLYSLVETRPQACAQGGDSSCYILNAESYDLTLKTRFAKDLDPLSGGVP